MTDSRTTTYSQPPLGWAFFLGCSWTWVIGMYLPVLLIRDYSFWGWLVFAVPNCLGAAAMGWVLKSPAQSQGIIQRHRQALELFSHVTIAFHVFFVLWMVSAMIGNWSLLVAMVLIQLSFTPIPTFNRSGMWAAVTIVASMGVAFFLNARHLLSFPGGSFDAKNLGGLAAVCLLGFIACPYLDLTFHEARQACDRPRDSKIAFGVGFCGVFFCMIALTLLYAMKFSEITRTVGAIFAIHFVLQAIFTVNAHGLALQRSGSQTEREGNVRMSLGFWLAIAAVIWVVARVLAEHQFLYAGLKPGEIGYRIFLSFYGLLFPAYAWLCMLPGKMGRAAVVRWLATCAVAMPFYWVAFIERNMPWVVFGVGIVLATRLIPIGSRRSEMAGEP